MSPCRTDGVAAGAWIALADFLPDVGSARAESRPGRRSRQQISSPDVGMSHGRRVAATPRQVWIVEILDVSVLPSVRTRNPARDDPRASPSCRCDDDAARDSSIRAGERARFHAFAVFTCHGTSAFVITTARARRDAT